MARIASCCSPQWAELVAQCACSMCVLMSRFRCSCTKRLPGDSHPLTVRCQTGLPGTLGLASPEHSVLSQAVTTLDCQCENCICYLVGADPFVSICTLITMPTSTWMLGSVRRTGHLHCRICGPAVGLTLVSPAGSLSASHGHASITEAVYGRWRYA